ncbi:hypothetical protein H5410_040296 [Solanum commersonii]|uniref:DUF7746 domain-containing protein n=1 Tax=Solanum commersonii TaxID=4109 RepID=A0A9J5XS34_SOLCO|nr:hypothetical protein H5410_040296 [Solanum commersonii]
MIERDFTLSNKEITKSAFPPLQSFQINKNDKIVNFNAFSKLFENDTALVTTHHINVMIKQKEPIYTTVHRMLMYSTICKTNKNSNKTIAETIIAGFTGQLKGKGKVVHASIQPPPDIEDFKLKDFSDLENFLEKTFKGNNLKPLKVNNLLEGESSKNMEFPDEMNKIS